MMGNLVEIGVRDQGGIRRCRGGKEEVYEGYLLGGKSVCAWRNQVLQRRLILGDLEFNRFWYGTGKKVLLNRGCPIKGVKRLIVSAIALKRSFMKILVNRVLLCGFLKLRFRSMPLLQAKCCPVNRYIIWYSQDGMVRQASQILRASCLVDYVGDGWESRRLEN
ncbi:hypothetical protein BDR22DRAFT_695553 [Usnea florida]